MMRAAVRRKRPFCPKVRFRKTGPKVTMRRKITPLSFQSLYPASRVSTKTLQVISTRSTRSQATAAMGKERRVKGCNNQGHIGRLIG
jgi:hypothetical protein